LPKEISAPIFLIPSTTKIVVCLPGILKLKKCTKRKRLNSGIELSYSQKNGDIDLLSLHQWHKILPDGLNAYLLKFSIKYFLLFSGITIFAAEF
jgi:hypothetical protein